VFIDGCPFGFLPGPNLRNLRNLRIKILIPPKYHDQVVRAYSGPKRVIAMPNCGHDAAHSLAEAKLWLVGIGIRHKPSTIQASKCCPYAPGLAMSNPTLDLADATARRNGLASTRGHDTGASPR
jgi:hypothetical protein